MHVKYALLGLLLIGPRHGYDLKTMFDRTIAPEGSLAFGQVYSTLGRLERDELVEIQGTAAGSGPKRKIYKLTPGGQTQIRQWLHSPEPPEPQLQATLYAKVVLTILAAEPVGRYLDIQRHAHLERMRELTSYRRDAEPAEALLADYALFHLEADLRWLELTASRVDVLEAELAGVA